MPDQTFYVQSRRAARQKRLQKAQHLFAALILASSGFGEFDRHPIFAVIAMLVAALLVGSVILEKKRQHHAGGVAWAELAGAALMFVEAYEKTRGRHHLSFVILWFLTPIPYVLFAFFDAQIGMRRYIRVDDRGVELRTRLLFGRRVAWDEIRGYRVNGDVVDFGGRSIRLKDVVDRDAAAQWLVSALQRRGIAELPPQ